MDKEEAWVWFIKGCGRGLMDEYNSGYEELQEEFRQIPSVREFFEKEYQEWKYKKQKVE